MKDQNELLNRLLKIENSLESLYRLGAQIFADDSELTELLNNLAEDEKDHAATLKDAIALTGNTPPASLCIYVDAKTIERIAGQIASAEEKLSNASMTKVDMISAVADLEFSEVNKIYLFAIKALSDTSKIILTKTFNLGHHKDVIIKFISEKPEYAHLLRLTAKIPEAGKLNLLIIEEDEIMREAFDILLSEFGDLDITSNLQNAISMLQTRNYAAVISDIKGSGADAAHFVESILKRSDELASRILFLSDIDSEQTELLSSKKLNYLEKPVSLKDIKTKVMDIIASSPLSA